MRDPRSATRLAPRVRPRGRWLRAAGVVAVVLFAGGPLSANQQMVPPLQGFLAFVAGGALGLLTTIVGIVQSFRRGLGVGRAGVLLGIVPAAILVYLATDAVRHPPINDVSTDLERPPRFVQAPRVPANRDRDMTFPPEFVPVVRESYPDVRPLELPAPPGEVFDRAVLLAQGVPRWEVTLVDRDRLVFEGVETSRTFRFRDDFVVRVQAKDGGSRVDMRSKSRDGRGDLGANAERIRTFLGKIRATL